jgi:CheY-like chemotaxis protein
LSEAIDCIIGQTLREWELIIVDDTFHDNTTEIDTALIRRYPFVNWVVDGRRRGLNAARNFGLSEVKAPLVLFLDLKMPGTDGFQVLDWIRQQPRLRRLLTVVLSSSTSSRDVDKAYALGAKTYFGKYPVAQDVKTVFQLANAMLTVDEIEKFVLPGIRPSPTSA